MEYEKLRILLLTEEGRKTGAAMNGKFVDAKLTG